MNHTIPVTDKKIRMLQSKYVAVNQDKEVDVYTFKIPRYYGEIDLSQGTVYCRYTLPSGQGDQIILAVEVTEEYLLAGLTLTEGVTSETGEVALQLIINVADKVWHSKTASMYVARKLAPSSLEFEPDILNQHLIQLQGIRDETIAVKDSIVSLETQIYENTDAIGEFEIRLSNVELVAGDPETVISFIHEEAQYGIYTNTDATLTADTIKDAIDETQHNTDLLAGAGHTSETVKGNADAIAMHETRIGANETHRSGDGSDHTRVVENAAAIADVKGAGWTSENLTNHEGRIAAVEIHAAGSGSDHTDVASNTTHRNGNGSDHAHVALNDTHRAGDGNDHAQVAANKTEIETIKGAGWNGETIKENAAAIALNTAHAQSDGSAHSKVLQNENAITSLQSEKIDKVAAPVAGNLPAILADGSLADSGQSPSDFEGADPTILKEADVINALTSTETNKPLSAYMGYQLSQQIGDIGSALDAINGEAI